VSDTTRTDASSVSGSFRDHDSRVFSAEGEILRSLSGAALADYEALAASRFFSEAQRSGAVVRTELLSGFIPPPGCRPPAGCAAVLRHERIPFLSWPFEWPFSMLKDASLLTLELIDNALDEGLILKDGTPYNVQWRGAAPVFIDVGSFERLSDGEPWFGYRQFCMQFLYPLMLQSYREVPYRPLLRGQLDGIAPDQMRNLLSLRDRFRRGVLTNVVLHARLERGHSGRSATDARRELKQAGFKPELIKANVRRLARLIRKLDWKPGESEWSEYREISTYDEEQLRDKEAFAESAITSAAPELVWDLGCNDGRFSRIAASEGAYVVAIDGDEVAVERLYRALRSEGSERILPLALDLVDSSPGLGWRGSERERLEERGKPDLVLALALVHHLAIGANVPLAALVDWLADLGAALVIEFPTREDPMVARLLSRKRPDAHPDYGLENFETLLERRFTVARRKQLGSRVLFEALPQ
jgi:SAM-dependent methyltransferase